MLFTSINPATEEHVASYETLRPGQVAELLDRAVAAQGIWASMEPGVRGEHLYRVAKCLRDARRDLSRLVTTEMGKPIYEAESEVDKCATTLEWFATNGSSALAAKVVATPGVHSRVQHLPLGVILAVMPWNYPLWQFFRAAVPALLAGNAVVLKPAPNVAGCAYAIERAFGRAGVPVGVASVLLVDVSSVAGVVGDPRVSAVTLTGSTAAGASIAQAAGLSLKKCVLELGGSDPFIVLGDADVDRAAAAGRISRFRNAGQACVAAKRFIVDRHVYDRFVDLLAKEVSSLNVGDPMRRSTKIGPLARADLVSTLRSQLIRSVDLGAVIVAGGNSVGGRGYYFEPTIIADASCAMAAFTEETFGPLAAIARVDGEEEAIAMANASTYGLGCSIFTGDRRRGLRIAGRIEAGSVFINGVVASDPRLPFGGIKRSGFGRELSKLGVQEFTNIQTVCDSA